MQDQNYFIEEETENNQVRLEYYASDNHCFKAHEYPHAGQSSDYGEASALDLATALCEVASSTGRPYAAVASSANGVAPAFCVQGWPRQPSSSRAKVLAKLFRNGDFWTTRLYFYASRRYVWQNQ
jgi:hypothetical protein